MANQLCSATRCILNNVYTASAGENLAEVNRRKGERKAKAKATRRRMHEIHDYGGDDDDDDDDTGKDSLPRERGG